MITGKLSQLHLYKPIHPNLSKAIDAVLSENFLEKTKGRYDVDGDTIFYMVNEYETKPFADCEPERHRRYTDIQIMIAGEERFGYTTLKNQLPSTDFLPDNDVSFFTIAEEELNYIKLSAGEFIIFFPDDIHQPEVFAGKPAIVKKVVVKVDLPGI